jgi:L-ascorbate metabolism protein UlaG (beta-lactamase superfamily)
LGVVALLVAAALVDGCAATGTAARGSRLDRMRSSPQWKDGMFVNTLPEKKMGASFSTLVEWIKGVPNEHPTEPVPIVKRRASDFEASPDSGLRITWLGHSSLLVEIDGQRVLFDPIWGKRASPFSFAGPSRFHPPPLALDQLPGLDAVVISHDHYDHLDHETIVALEERDLRFVVPLGVGAHLEGWGVPQSRITELDWWGQVTVGRLKLVATPARHFSGRSVTMSDRNKTLWAGWAVLGPRHRVFYSGDTAMFPGFSEIGRRLGPFDATMIEVGAYNARWALGGKVMVPVHWGTFALGIHPWTEPVERVLVAAGRERVAVAVPRPGESFEPARPPALVRWWPGLPFRTGEEDPIVSSGLTGFAAR